MKIGLGYIATVAATLSLVGMTASFVQAGPDDNAYVVNGETIPTDVAAPEDSPLDHLYSGWRYRKGETQRLQTDDFENPAFVAVEQAIDEFEHVNGTEGKSCSACHADVSEFKGLRAGLPRWDENLGKPENMEMIINECRTDRMGADAWKWDSPQMLGMAAYVGLQSRGMTVDVQTDGPMSDWAAKGKDLYYQRVGQLDMACAQCHEDNAGNMIRADHLSQGQINGFPTYRLKWNGLGSAHRRFKGCMKNIRAIPFKVGSDEFLALELYVTSRGEGLSVETPAVRN